MARSLPQKSRIKKLMNFLSLTRCVSALCLLTFLAGCQTTAPDPELAARRAAIAASIAAEKPGDYFVARRFYKKDYKMWGWVRKPGQPWNTAQLVMLNEQRKLAPDRAEGTLGIDNNFEYHLRGFFSGDKVYEPASNHFYPEFVLTDYTLVDRTPPLIFRDRRSTDPAIRILEGPQ
jgi:hypothetical protein